MTAVATGVDRREYQRRVETLLGEIQDRVGELHRLKLSGVHGRALRGRKRELSRTRGRLRPPSRPPTCHRASDARSPEGGTTMELDQAHVWITTRRLKPGTRDDFSRAWKPSEFPAGMLRAYECYSSDGSEVVGISIWDSPESRDRYRLSEVETKRRQEMAPYVTEERSGVYVGRELKIPQR